MLILLISTLVYICYSEAVHYGLLKWDSQKYIIENECIHGLTLFNVRCIFSSIYFSNWHPLTSLSYAIEYEFFGQNPKIYHVTNIVFHAINSLLIYVVTKTLLLTKNIDGTQLRLAALISAVLFAVHPQHVESVSWVSERKGLLSTCFFLLSIWSYIQYVLQQALRAKKVYFTLSFAAFVLSLLAKSIAITMPVLLLLIDLYLLNRLSHPLNFRTIYNQLKPLIFEKSVFFLAAFVMIGVTVFSQVDGGSMSNLDNYPIQSRLINAIYSVFFYIGKWLLPLELSPFYSDPAFVEHGNWATSIFIVLAFSAVVAVSVGLLKSGKPVPFLLLSFILISLSPVIGIITLGSHAAADRYTYMPLIPLYLITGYYGANFFVSLRTSRKWLAGICFVVIVLTLINVCRTQVTLWKNDITLWSYVTRGWTGSNTLPFTSLANAVYEQGNYKRAIRVYHLARSKGFVPPRFYLGLARSYGYLGEYHRALEVYQYMLDQQQLETQWRIIAESDIADIRKKMLESNHVTE